MKKHTVLFGTSILMFQASITGQNYPNIVFIMADDMGQGDVGCYNPDSKIPTPNMDTLAQQGIRFTNLHSPSSICSPSRYGLLTGRYCWRTSLQQGALGPFDPLLTDTARVTIADILKSKGYATAITGKWHTGLGTADSIDYLSELKPGPLELGFDYFFGKNASLNMSPFCFIENHFVTDTPNVDVPSHIFCNSGNYMMVEGWRHEDVGPTITQKAKDWLNNHVGSNPTQPFFLYLPTHTPHRPCYPPDFIRGRSQAGVRGDMVAEFDWTVGEIIQTLKDLGKYDSTLFIVTSDNGAIGGNTPLHPEDSIQGDSVFNHDGNMYWKGCKTQIYEGGHRVPFIARWEGKIPSATVTGEMTCLTDIMATFAELVGYTLHDTIGEDSHSLLPVLTGETYQAPIREVLVSHSMWGKFAIRKNDWKLIFTTESGGWGSSGVETYPGGQLYNMATDSLETNNLYNQRLDKVFELETILDDYNINTSGNPPQIAPIEDIILPKDTSIISIISSISDGDGQTQSVYLNAYTDNKSLIPILSSDANDDNTGTITFLPASGTDGTGRIYLRIWDSGWLTDTTSFKVTIYGENNTLEHNTLKKNELLIYPNPTNNYLKIANVDKTYNNALIRIYNLSGVPVMEKSIILNNEYCIDVSDYSPGIYFIKIKIDGKTIMKPFVLSY